MANNEKKPYSASDALAKSLDRSRAKHASGTPSDDDKMASRMNSSPEETPGRFAETLPTPMTVLRQAATRQTRRDFLAYGAGVILAAAGFWYLLPEETTHLHTSARKEALLNGVLRFDDDIAEALYSQDRTVPTYDKTLAQSPDALRNNYDGQTPDPAYIDDWTLTLTGLASGKVEHLTLKDIQDLATRIGLQEQVTRLVCVEGWSAIAWWGGVRFADLLAAYPPASDATWARLDSSVNLDSDGNSDPYYVSIDLPTAQHPQTLLATHQSDQPLTVEHGAPLRLVVPMKLGLKNIKAITKISYVSIEPADYWNERGYSKYDGL